MSSDGRLDLDDLGHVIEQASSLDDVVGTDDPRPTLRERLESRGALPWVRRHRLALPERHSDPLRSQAIDGARAR